MNTRFVSKRPTPAPKGTPAAKALTLMRSPRILVADDDPTTNSRLIEFARATGYQIVSVSDGAEAYRRLQTDADFRAAIINMTMPNIHGGDIVRHMKTENRLKRIPVIILAGDDYRQVSESFSAGAIAVLPKPFAPEQLWRIVRMVSDLPRQKRRAA